MIEIPTARGLIILIDDEDEPIVAGLSWYAVEARGSAASRYYAHARLLGAGGRRILMHRLVMGAPSGLHVHHKNGNGLDNRKTNLELLTPSKHMTEHVAHTPGVYFDNTQGQFRAAIRIERQHIDLGLHRNEAHARRAVWLGRQLLPDLSPAERLATAANIKAAARRT